jgi:hypothetical protein
LQLDPTGYLQDPADPFTVYSLESPPFVPVFNCPSGYTCNQSPFLLMDCCGTTVFENLLGLTDGQRNARIISALGRCSILWESCGVDTGGGVISTPDGPGLNPTMLPLFYNGTACCPIPCFGTTIPYCIPAGSVLSPVSFAAAQAFARSIACRDGLNNKVAIGNGRQCYIASCPPGDPFSTEQCIEAGTFGDCLFAPSPAALQARQAFWDAYALNIATQNANAILAGHGCLVCNAERTASATCPGNPGIQVSGTIPAGKYCVPAGGSQAVQDALASQDLFNQLNAGLKALGCACTVTTSLSTYVNGNCAPGQTVCPDILITPTCNQLITLSPANTFPQPMMFLGGLTTKWSDLMAGLGVCGRQGVVTFTPFDFASPAFTFNTG